MQGGPQTAPHAGQRFGRALEVLREPGEQFLLFRLGAVCHQPGEEGRQLRPGHPPANHRPDLAHTMRPPRMDPAVSYIASRSPKSSSMNPKASAFWNTL